MKITAKQNARKWTKERLKLHPGEFIVVQKECSVVCWQGELAIMVKNLNDSWRGWFPVKDIEISE
jgi:hypothetical protein